MRKKLAGHAEVPACFLISLCEFVDVFINVL